MKNRIIDLVVTLTGLVAARAFALLTTIFIARLAGASAFGGYSIFITVFVTKLEVPNAIDTTFIRFANATGSKHPPDVYQMLAVVFKLLYALTIVLIGLSIVPFFALYVFNKPEISDILVLSLLSA